MTRLIVVSNRVALPRDRSARAGGLAVGVLSALKRSGGGSPSKAECTRRKRRLSGEKRRHREPQNILPVGGGLHQTSQISTSTTQRTQAGSSWRAGR